MARLPSAAPPADESKLHRAHAALLKLARSQSFLGENLIADFRAITELAGQTLEVARCSIWLYHDHHSRIRCLDLYDAQAATHSDGEELNFKDHPSYFLALEERRLIVAHDARTDPQTREFGQHYLGKHGITSMLDAAVRKRGQLVGVICMEHVGQPRQWSTEEEVFVCAFADLVSLALEANERVWAEAALAASETRFREIIQNATDAIVLVEVCHGQRFQCELTNPAALEVSGFTEEQMLGKTPAELLPPENAANMQRLLEQCVATQRPQTAERVLTLPAGRRTLQFVVVPIRHERGHVYRIAVIARDVTAQRRLEHDLDQARKMEPLGSSASGLALQFNNLPPASVVPLALLELELAPAVRQSASVVERLAALRQSFDRGRDLVQQVLLFGRKQTLRRQPVRLDDAVTEVVRLLQPTTPPEVELQCQPVAGVIPVVWGDATQLHQLLVNLITNAVHAVTQRGRGRVEVGVAAARTDSGPAVQLSIRDTGAGMEWDVQERMFEPFFTTKPAGRGTGLGLAIVHSVVQAHHGAIQCRSHPDHGTHFTVIIPCGTLPAASNNSGHHGSEAAPPLGWLQNRQTLFVDDEEMLRRMGGSYLAHLGAIPVLARDRAEALNWAEASVGPPAAIVSDQFIPDGTGLELIRRLRSRWPSLPAVLMTGLATEVEEALSGQLDVILLEKPFRLENLAKALDQARQKAPPG